MLAMIITWCFAVLAFLGALIFIIIIPLFGVIAIAGFQLSKKVALAASFVAVVTVAFLGLLLMDTAESLAKNARSGRYLTLSYTSDSDAADSSIDNKE